MNDDILPQVARLLGVYDAADLISTIGALQLMPENAHHTIRLEALAHVAATLSDSPSAPRISAPRLRIICNMPPLGNSWLVWAEDPCDNAFTEAFTFHGGSYVVFPGNLEEPTFILRHVAKAIFLSRPATISPQFSAVVRNLLIAGLTLSNEMARRAGLTRGVDPVKAPGKGVVIPDAQQLDRLKRAVTFTVSECRELLEYWNLDESILDTLCTHQGTVTLDEYQIASGSFLPRPLIRTGEQIIIAMPGMLLASLINAILRLSVEFGITEELTERYTEAVWDTVVTSLGYLNNDPVDGTPCGVTPAPCVREGFFSLDRDKALYAVLLTDMLDGYDSAAMFGEMPMERINAYLEQRLPELRETIFGLQHPPKDLLILFLVQSYSRQIAIGLDGAFLDSLWPAQVLAVSVGELVTITLLENGQQLALWKFATASNRLHKEAMVLAWSTLNEYYYFREREYSYYLSDEVRPHVHSLLAGGSGNLRREVLQQRDWHAVPAHTIANAILEVVNFYGSRQFPIYVPLNAPPTPAAFFVEGLSIPVWVVDSSNAEQVSPSRHSEVAIFAEAIAYWIWQFSPSLSPILAPLAEKHRFVRLQLCQDPDEDWRQLPASEEVNSETALSTVADLGSAMLTITLHPGLGALCGRHDNYGERVLMRTILQGLRDLLSPAQSIGLSDVACDVMLDLHAPLGAKKMLLFHNTEFTPDLDPTGLPAFRKVQSADVNEALDRLGDHLRNVEAMQIGPIPDDQRVPVLRDKVVAFFYGELQTLVASLSPDGLLEGLVVYSEAIVRATALNEINIPTRLACFGADPGLAAHIAAEHPERGEAAMALRFVIEFVVAQPPRGENQFSLGVLDRLIAIASQIVNFGFDCDLVHYQLADLKHGILPSGRFGTTREDFTRRRASYMAAFMSAHISSSIRAFERQGNRVEESSGDETDLIARIDLAAVIEFGFSVSDILTFLRTMVDLSEEAGVGVSRMPVSEVVERTSALLSWSRASVEQMLELLLSRPREDYLTPPAPYAQHETFPWRFNRKLSYLRRPLLLRTQNGIEEVIWGPRHTFVAAKYLLSLCLEGRLKPDTKPMRQVMGKISGRQGEDFNDAVADLMAQQNGLIVHRRVKKVKGLTIPQGMSGDFDVLVVDPPRRRLIVMECKALAHARTPYEMATETENLVRAKDGKRSAVDQVREQAQWLRDNLQAVLAWLGMESRRKWQVEACVVVDHVMAAPYLQDPPVPILTIGDLRKQLGG